MAIFAIVAIRGENELKPTVEREFPGALFQVASGHWLVKATGTSQEIANKIGLNKSSKTGTGIVYKINGYFGLANPAVWEWLAENSGDDGG